jgi:uncharacterized protein YjdB
MAASGGRETLGLLHPMTRQPDAGSTMPSVSAYRSDGSTVPSGELQWSTSDPEILAIAARGSVRGVAFGNARVTVSDGVASRSLTLSVRQAVATVRVSPASVQLHYYDCNGVPLMATPLDATGDTLLGREVSWLSSSYTIASVNGDGFVKPVHRGHAQVTARVGNAVGTSAIQVLDDYDKDYCED